MVNDTLRCAAFTVEGASPLGAVAVGWAIVLDLYIFVDNLVVVPLYYCPHVFCTTVADLQRISVEHLRQRVARGEMFVDKLQEFLT